MTQPDPMKAMRAIYDQSRGAREAAQQLQPLLTLLEHPEGEGPSPVEKLQEILETILVGQRQLHLSLEDLHAKADALLGSKRLVSMPR
ncbi:hypothetical protein [Tianweitania sediminis]|uniref:Uncharacterized protein n=1 Tax=Tianweitania sediminis TaxID=1502156 RepID=A0A8J7RNC3_9HYPH|nr:hypothetical protein [Tianweitania sediminis]MBP0441506.1 hypothetical protein [Tianweitania sediminis]